MTRTTKALSFLSVLLGTSLDPMLLFVSAAKVSQEEADKYAAAGHPMFIKEPVHDADRHDADPHESDPDNDRMLQDGGGCTQRVVAVYESAYDVDYKDGDFQIGVTDIYRPNNLNDSIGKWWWDWAVFRGTNYERSYGTMMIEYNPKESITFGFSVTQSYYPISGGCVQQQQRVRDF
jgi:hypothetical protein